MNNEANGKTNNMTIGKKAALIFTALTVDERRAIGSGNVKLAVIENLCNSLWAHIVGNDSSAVAFAVSLKCGNKDLINA